MPISVVFSHSSVLCQPAVAWQRTSRGRGADIRHVAIGGRLVGVDYAGLKSLKAESNGRVVSCPGGMKNGIDVPGLKR